MNVQYEQHQSMDDNLQMLQRAIVEKNNNQRQDRATIAYPHFKMLNDIKHRFLELTIQFNKRKKKIKLFSAILTFFLNESLLFSGFVYGMTTHRWFALPLLIALFFNIALGLGIALIDKMSYPFIYRWLKKRSNQEQVRQKIDSYRSEINALIHQQNFQHAYMTHLQLIIHNYEGLCEAMRHNQMADFNLLKILAENVQQLKSFQSRIMNDFINERDGLEIFDEIYKMETLINTINVMLNKTDTVKEKQQKFIQRHQDFLHNQGLNYLLDKNASEHLKTLL
jgi:hypothetical protein